MAARKSKAISDQMEWGELLPEPWVKVVECLLGEGVSPRKIQQRAVASGLLISRKTVLVAAPTNSGKSLVGTLVLLEAIQKGKRAVLIEPLTIWFQSGMCTARGNKHA